MEGSSNSLGLAAPFTTGVGFYTFYAMQPFLLKLYGQPNAYGIAGLAAAIVAGAQIIGGLVVPHLRLIFKRRTSALFVSSAMSLVLLLLMGVITHFWVAVILFVAWGLLFAAEMPIRQTYLNGLIPSQQRATVLSFDSLLSSAGAAGIQPVLGRTADLWSYSASFLVGAGIKVLALPFLLLAKKEKSKSDLM
jgi:MFS family permease